MLDFEETILSQFANSPTIMQLVTNLNGYIDPSADIDAFYNLLWNVNTAVGYGLDVWGRIVGVGRVLKLPTADFFGWGHGAGASGLGWSQAIFYHGNAFTANYAMLDGPYRALILAKALANISDATIPSINQILINLFGAAGPLPVVGNCYCTDDGSMTMTFTFGSTLTAIQRAIVTQSGVLPRPAGVAATVVEL